MPIPGNLPIQGLEDPSFLSLYIHVPFCSKKCPYCHFYVTTSQHNEKRYVDALLLEWERTLPLLQGRTIYSLYFGGGTPSKLSLNSLKTIFQTISTSINFHEHMEITLEANPEDLSTEYLISLKEFPINRLSLGVQSLHDPTLRILERQHDAQKAINGINAAYSVGFSNISIDLMYDLPYQTIASWEYTLAALKNLPITHLSLYNLTIEPQTAFYKRKAQLEPNLPDDAKSLHFLTRAIECFENLGLKRYEISAFAKEGFYSRHNVGYWLGREFYGYGPSAFSYLHRKRFRNICHLSHYSSALENRLSPQDFEECLDDEASCRELLAIRLRLLEGVDMTSFPPLSKQLLKTLHDLSHSGFVSIHNHRLALTQKGLLFYDSVAAEII